VKTLAAIFFIIISISACTSSTTPGNTAAASSKTLSPDQAAAKKGYVIVKPVKQIRDYLIDGWNYIDKQNLVLHSSPSRSYLLALKRSCHDLNSTENIFTETRTGVLMAGLDAIMVRPRHNNITQPCYIESMYLLKKTDADDKPEATSN
jgi:Family of unknown function (DUF6491)